MIEAEIHRGDELLMTRVYSDAGLTLEHVLQRLERYVVDEMFNADGDCTLKVRFKEQPKAA